MIRGTILALALLWTTPASAQEPPPAPYSCRQLYAEQRKCAMDANCDKRVIDRLTKECLRDGGRP